MKYLIDTGNLEAIKRINEFYPVEGVTTNPTLVSKEKTNFWTLIKSIREVIGKEKELHVQTVQTKAEGMVEEAKRIYDAVGGKFFVKIPIGEEGLKATMMLKNSEIGVTMTAIFTPQQALLSAKAGAAYVAPYVNRLDNILGDGERVVAEIVQEFDFYGLSCEVLAASFKNCQQIHECALSGCHTATIAPDLFKTAISHPMTDMGVKGFMDDWKSVYGEKSILDL